MFTAFWLLIMRSSCVLGLGPYEHTSRCEIVCSWLHMYVITWSPYPHFLVFYFDYPTPTRSQFNIYHTGQSKLWPGYNFSAGFIRLLPKVSVSSFFHPPNLLCMGVSDSSLVIFKQDFLDFKRKVEDILLNIGCLVSFICLSRSILVDIKRPNQCRR